MSIESILVWIIIGAVAGWLASLVMKTNRRQGLLEDIVVGVIGGLIGGFVLNLAVPSAGVTGLNITSLLTAFVGAIIFLALTRVVRR